VKYARQVFSVLVISTLLVAAGGELPGRGDARAATCARGTGYEQALAYRAALRADALRKARLAAARARQERYESGWTGRWTRAYGVNVGRWADDAIHAGWPDSQLWTLGRVIRLESGGVATARNSYSGCSGLLQLAPGWWRGIGDPFDPAFNLRRGLYLWRASGWRPWVTY